MPKSNTFQPGKHFLQIPGPTNVPDRVLRAMDYPTIDHRGPEFAEIAKNVNIHGLICSGDDLKVLRKFNKLIKITPGVKMFARNDDQKRVTFAHNALQDGASFVVIGRELIESKKPLELLKKYGEQYKNKNLWTK